MTLVISVLFFTLQDFLSAGQVTKDEITYELWRIDNLTNDDVLYELEVRAHGTDEIWQHKNTVHIILGDYEIELWKGLLDQNNVQWTVLATNLTGKFDDEFINKYINPVTETTTIKAVTLKLFTAREPSQSEENPQGNERKIYHLWSTEDITESNLLSELWRVQNVKSEEILEEFNDRAHMTEDIWKRNKTIDFILGKHETEYWRKLLQDHGVKYKVLNDKIKGKVNEKFIEAYMVNRRGGNEGSQRKRKVVTAIYNKSKIVDITTTTPVPNKNSDESRDEFDIREIYGVSELWRAEEVTSEDVLSEFNDRAHMTDEIWKVNNTIYFILGKHETNHWRRLLQDNNIKFKVLDSSLKGKFDDKFVKKYIRQGLQ